MSYPKTEKEKLYDTAVKGCVPKPNGHFIDISPKEGETILYVIATIASSKVYGGKRAPAVCTSFERAKEIIENNEGDIWEHSYMLAVIEPVYADCPYGHTFKSYWYCWNLTLNKYEPVEIPPGYQNTFGWGIG